MKILIDADGCPVVDIAVKIANNADVECIIICDTSHVFEKKGAKTITVSQGSDSVDFVLVNMAKAGDIVVTQDYGLAAMCLAKRCVPLNQDGMIYSDENIDALLMSRHNARKIRNAGGRLKGSPKRSSQQNEAFGKSLKNLLQEEIK
ncbi:MAG: YaiI/YqxD family protein [Clostridiales bacterium]|jgi:uncharacterized protein YaiI (UPF0178 family)|nr:YaiI/YqxD family protein [Clostridiales bacterium]